MGVTVTVEPAPGVSTLPLSSYARLRRLALTLAEPGPDGVQLRLHEAVPDAWRHVVPPSVDTSTLVTTPPPASVAVPVIVIGVPPCTAAPLAGKVMLDVGAVESSEAEAPTSPPC